jgi:hypothetical protein
MFLKWLGRINGQPPEFKYHLRLSTFGGRSAHLALNVHESGYKISNTSEIANENTVLNSYSCQIYVN